MGLQICDTPEAFKAWSQNLGHENVLTTFTSYGTVSEPRQAELIRTMGKTQISASMIDTKALARELALRIKDQPQT